MALRPWALSLLISCSLAGAEAEHAVRKRQIYYLCGTYPNYHYSLYPCYVSGSSACENGGQKIGVGCSIANQCVPYHRGPVACLRGCCCTVPGSAPAPPAGGPGGYGYCQNGQLSKVRCSAAGQCQQGQTCLNGLCCTTVQDEFKGACGGEYAVAQCSAARTCTQGFSCTASNYCCQCPVGKSAGRCNQGLCPNGYQCMDNGWCCGSCANNATPYGACYNGTCGGGRTCSAGNLCC